jgi:biotin-(acetyl-CoA carboxylase) ligase
MQFRLIEHGLVDSTSERAFEAIAARTARHGDAHVATAQTSGRGRLGRAWHSAPGEGLYLSVILFPGPPPLSPPGLTMAAGLAVLDAVRGLGLGSAQLKWPNDVVVPTRIAGSRGDSGSRDLAAADAVEMRGGAAPSPLASRPQSTASRGDVSPRDAAAPPNSGSPRAVGAPEKSRVDAQHSTHDSSASVRAAKLSGVLVETRGLDPEAPHYVVGIGINVAQREFPPALESERPVTSLALCGLDVRVERVRDELLAHLGRRLDSIRAAPARLCADFLLAAQLESARVRVAVGDATLEGELLGLALDEGLRIRLDDGRVQRVAIEFVRELQVQARGSRG